VREGTVVTVHFKQGDGQKFVFPDSNIPRQWPPFILLTAIRLKQGTSLGSEDQGLGNGLYYKQKKRAELGFHCVRSECCTHTE
jgi:hypothetical protein